MLLTPVAQIKVSIDGYVWDEDQRLVPLEENVREMDDGTPIPLDERERELQGLDRTYNPFVEEPGLFLRFARLEPTPDGILAFATEFGSLANSRLNNWKRSIIKLQSAIALRKAVNLNDPGLLSEHVRWVGSRLEVINPLAKRIIKSHEDFEVPHVMAPWSPPVPLGEYCHGDLLQPARDVLEWILRLWRIPSGDIVASQPRPGQYRLEIQVKSLLTVLWFQWVMAVCENQTFYDCEHCGRPILLVPQKTRNDRRYCSTACQMRAYRRRKAKAKQMRCEGCRLCEIAKAVSSDMATIKKWVGDS